MFFNPSSGRTQVWSCGGGTQSIGIGVLVLQGKLPKPDLAVMIDTEREGSDVMEYARKTLKPAMDGFGVELHIIRKSDWTDKDLFGGADGKSVLMPGFTNQGGEVGKLPNYCTGEWKRDAIGRWLRSKGVEQCDEWIGFSLEEMGRIKGNNRLKWRRKVYPLIHLRMYRESVINLVRNFGWPDPPRSACWMCPNKQDAEWLDMKLNRPGDFAKAVALEKEVQQTDPHFWLHQSCKPIDQVEFRFNRLPLFEHDRECFYGGMCGV